jgi:iron complex transport system substrate-binding protein
VWSSKNYDYMIVDGIRYDNENDGGNSTFTIPVENTTEPLTVIGDTVAMSTPHEIEYTIIWGEKKTDAAATVGEKTAGTDGEKAAGKDDENTAGADDEAISSRPEKDYQQTKKSAQKALTDFGLKETGKTKLTYATGFEIEKYGDYSLISIDRSGVFLLIPEEGDVPDGLPEGITLLHKPLDGTYLVSTSAMDLVNACGALDMIKLTGTDKNDWYIQAAREAMDAGQITYAGKYRAPDYELLLERNCNLAIENTMIYHEPAVKEKLTELGIPVLVETSSYESHPLGRLEWIKLYGALYDREAEADSFFKEQLQVFDSISDKEKSTDSTVLFFHVTANGLINVRKNGDYITKMIELSGGRYALTGAGDGENALSSMNMQMEDFYSEGRDADIIIYNSTIAGELGSIDDLIALDPLFKDFKAVRDKEVYCTEKNLFQKTTGVSEFMRDLSDVFNGVKRDYTYLKKLE